MVRQTEMAEKVQRHGREAGVDRQTMAKFREERRRRGRGADVGHRWADDGEVPRREAEVWSWSRRGS